jgi:hypothetical protein
VSTSTRSAVSVTLAVLAALVLALGTVAFYVRAEVVDSDAFADRALVALEDDDVRRVVRRELVTALIDRGSADLAAARPLLESVVDAVIDTQPFQALFRRAAVQANRVFFVRDRENALVDISDAAKLVDFGLRTVSPRLAREVPTDIQPELARLSQDDLAAGTLAVADEVRVLGIVLPVLALLLFAAAIVVAPDRRMAVLRSGLAAGTAGAVLAIVLFALRARTLAGVFGEDELTDAEVRDAAAGVLDAFAGDLLVWALLLSLGGLVVAAAAAALDPEDVERPLARLWTRLTATPRTTWGRALRGAVALAGGVLVVLNPVLALQAAAVLAGAVLVFFGTAELLALLQGGAPTAERERRSRARAFAVAGVAAVAVAAAAAAFVLVTTDSADPVEASVPGSSKRTCNGSIAMCELTLGEAVFAGTHNAFSAADSPGWFIANQRRTIERQLSDGIRLFLIDAHWGIEDARGRVRTDFKSEGRSRNKVAKALPPEQLEAAVRLAGRVGAGDLEGERDVWLCHTVCELGATRMVDTLTEMRTFLDRNRGEVLILFVEPYVAPAEIEKVFAKSGLDRYVATLSRDEPLPTLGELVRENRRVIVFAEKDADGTVPWYLDGFSFVQDTPLGAENVRQLSCELSRGTADSPLLMLNHWADLFPPRAEPNRPFLKENFVIRRAHECGRERGLPVSLIAVDHYDQGRFIEAVDALNAERVQRLRQRQRVGG